MAKNKKKKGGGNATAAAMNNKMRMQNILANNMLGNEYLRGRRHGWALSILFMSYLLHNQYGFGQKRLMRLLGDLNEFSLEVIAFGPDGKFTAEEGKFQGLAVQDVIDVMDEECKIWVDFDKGYFRAKEPKRSRKKDIGSEEFVRVGEVNGSDSV